MTTFFFVRHGVTSHTGHKLSGWLPDIHLSERGKEQAEAAAQMLAQVPIKAIYSSPIERTLETAQVIAAHHKLEVQTTADLGEVRYGKWTNRSFKSLARTKMWTTVQRFPSAVRFPDGETLREVQSRAVDEVERLRGRHPKRSICCVSHADVIKLVAAHYLGMHIDLFQRIDIGPASVTAISVSDDGPRVLALNAPPHVDGGKG
ncbi:MAG: MSMEG_4193 family putative phosphomutase [Actinomycetota bacterium]